MVFIGDVSCCYVVIECGVRAHGKQVEACVGVL